MGNPRAAFTLAQREELERQTMIFKYMVASIPVPPQLLLPLKSNTTLGWTRNSSSSSSDPEPWRCKRTDGKKWRCSRDVAPHQKYCERHSHKNRPRSRKPVEFLSNNAAIKPPMQSRDSTLVGSSVTGQESLSHLLPYHTQKEFSHAVVSATPRSLEWFMKGEVIALPNSDQLQWQHPPHQHQQQQQRHRPLSSYGPDQELQAQGGGGLMNDQCSLLLGMASLEGHNCPKGSASSSKREPVSSLSLAMFGGRGEVGEEGDDDGRESVGQMDLGVRLNIVSSTGECERRVESRPHWMSPGGPLAEALCLGTTSIGKSSPSDLS
ncbi:hypothetical protein CRG98_015233 [Punica granatum]|nr:hypothetical protein CRG98_015233 [Punica granatum]